MESEMCECKRLHLSSAENITSYTIYNRICMTFLSKGDLQWFNLDLIVVVGFVLIGLRILIVVPQIDLRITDQQICNVFCTRLTILINIPIKTEKGSTKSPLTNTTYASPIFSVVILRERESQILHFVVTPCRIIFVTKGNHNPPQAVSNGQEWLKWYLTNPSKHRGPITQEQGCAMNVYLKFFP